MSAARLAASAPNEHFSRAVRAELAKTRRLRVAPIAGLLLLVVAGMSCAQLATGRQPESNELLMSYVMIAALVSPLLVAVLTSRQVDIEHSGGGWNLAGGLGIGPGLLCRAKFVTLAGILAIVVAGQTALIVAVGMAAGMPSLDAGRWLGYAACLLGVDLAMAAIQLWLASVWGNQLIGLGLGLLGSFIAMFSLLMPPWLANLIPWGYYAVISPVSFANEAVVPVNPPLGWVFGFWILVATGFGLATAKMEVK